MAHTLGHTLTNWLLFMDGLNFQPSTACGALPICCIDIYSWNMPARMCFVTLLVFACVPIP